MFDEIQIYPLSFGNSVEVKYLKNGVTVDRNYLSGTHWVANVRNRQLDKTVDLVHVNGGARITIDTTLVTLPAPVLWRSDPHDLVHILNAEPFFVDGNAEYRGTRSIFDRIPLAEGIGTAAERLLTVIRKKEDAAVDLIRYEVARIDTLASTSSNYQLRLYVDIDLTTLTPDFEALKGSQNMEVWDANQNLADGLAGSSPVLSDAKLVSVLNVSQLSRAAVSLVSSGGINWKDKAQLKITNVAVTAIQLFFGGTTSLKETLFINEYE